MTKPEDLKEFPGIMEMPAQQFLLVGESYLQKMSKREIAATLEYWLDKYIKCEKKTVWDAVPIKTEKNTNEP